MNLKPLNTLQTLAWFTAGFSFGLFLIWFGFQNGLFEGDSRVPMILVFLFWWVLAVLFLRFFLQEKNIGKLFGFSPSKKR